MTCLGGTINSDCPSANISCFSPAKTKSPSRSLKRPLWQWTSYTPQATIKVSAGAQETVAFVCVLRELLLTRRYHSMAHGVAAGESSPSGCPRLFPCVPRRRDMSQRRLASRDSRVHGRRLPGRRGAAPVAGPVEASRALVYSFVPACSGRRCRSPPHHQRRAREEASAKEAWREG